MNKLSKENINGKVFAELSIEDKNYTAMKNESGVFVEVEVNNNNLTCFSKLKCKFSKIKLSSKKQDCGFIEFAVDFDATYRNNASPSQDTKSVKIYLNV